jgi:hypothetical protein
MGLYKIWGFQLPDQSMSATWGSQTVTETCLIEMSSPLEDIINVQNALPAYDGGTTPEPTFTIGLSYHPERTDLVLKEAPSVKEHPTSGRPFWVVELVYETAQWLDKTLPYENQGIGNVGRNKRLDTNPTDFIKYPWDEPPTWSGSTKQVQATVYQDSAGAKLVHANYLPLTEGIDVTIELEVHTFTWNVEYTMFTFATDIAPFIGKINDAVVFTGLRKHVLLETCSAVENYRTQNVGVRNGQSGTGAIATHHFVTVTATFVIDRRTSVQGYFREANRRVSMHTMQLANAGNPITPIWGYVPIDVNDRGDFAQSPWPLASLAYTNAGGFNRGIGFPYDALPTANPETDFWTIDPLYPVEADLTTFVAFYGLVIP